MDVLGVRVLYWPLPWGADVQGVVGHLMVLGVVVPIGAAIQTVLGAVLPDGVVFQGVFRSVPCGHPCAGPAWRRPGRVRRPLVRLLPNRSLQGSPFRVVFQSPAPGKNSGCIKYSGPLQSVPALSSCRSASVLVPITHHVFRSRAPTRR